MAYLDIMLERSENFVRTPNPSKRGIHLAQFLQVLIFHELRQGWRSRVLEGDAGYDDETHHLLQPKNDSVQTRLFHKQPSPFPSYLE